MRGISASGPVCGGRSTGDESVKSGDSAPGSTEEKPTVCFTGVDGKVLTFVKSSEPSASVKEHGPVTPKGSIWNNKRGLNIPPEHNNKIPKKEDDKVTVATNSTVSKIANTSAKYPADGPTDQPSSQTGVNTLTESEEYIRKEDEFMFKQEIEKSKVRLNAGRGNELDVLLSQETPSVPVNELFSDVDTDVLKSHLELVRAHMVFAKDDHWVTFLKAIETVLNTRLLGNTRSSEVSEQVESKIDDILATKDLSELEGFEVDINKKLDSDEVVDTNFWELTLSKIPFFKHQACCVIKEFKKLGTHKSEPSRPAVAPTVAAKDSSSIVKKDAAYERFMKSLKLEEDEQLLEEDVPYGSSSKPKPRYVVRVTTGFEWNKYNQSHFDLANPPPKHITGFKFNIFCSELEGSGTTPKWNLVKDGGSKDTCLIVFNAGKTYSPVAFRIPCREWETDHTRGFKNFFSNGVLHLYFNYRKHVYRR